MRIRTLIAVGFFLALSGNFQAPAAPVPKGRPADLAADWLREGNDRLGKQMNRKISAEIPYRNESGEVIFYAIQLDPQGVIIVSSDDLVEPVIAFSDCGTTNDLASESPLRVLLGKDLSGRNKHAANLESRYAAPSPHSTPNSIQASHLEHAQNNKAKWEKHAKSAKYAAVTAAGYAAPQAAATDTNTIPTYSGSPSISDIRIAPIISSRWNQLAAQSQNCYNYYTPNNYYAGCVAIAMAQLLRYWQYPVSGIGQNQYTIYVNEQPQTATTRGGDDSGGAYNWNQMPLNPESAAYNLAQWQMIGRLCYDAGLIANMDYTPGGSSAGLLLASKLTQAFGFSNAHDLWVNGGIPDTTRDEVLISNLAAGYPVITGIRQGTTTVGHAIIADGFGYSSGVTYFHVNYGWGNSSATAWYNMPNMNSSPTAYTVVDVLIYNIFPTNSGEIVSGRIADTNGGLQSVTVTLTSGGTNYTAVTDTNGYYGLIVPGGTNYRITASKTGYSAGQITNVNVGTSGPSYNDPCGNYLAQDLILTSTNTSIPTLGEYGTILFMASILLIGIRAVKNQRFRQKTG